MNRHCPLLRTNQKISLPPFHRKIFQAIWRLARRLASLKLSWYVHHHAENAPASTLSDQSLVLQFETSDLFEAKNLHQVLQHLGALHNLTTKAGGSLKEKAASGKTTTPVKKNTVKNLNGDSPGVKSTNSAKGSPSSIVSVASSSSLPDHSVASNSSPVRSKTPSVASLAADIATKEEFKYNPEVEAAAIRWIEQVLGVSSGGQSCYAFLKSGVILCKLANSIQPMIVPSVYEGALPYRQMENIGSYIRGCQQWGLRDEELFETADLFAERNLNSVVNHIHVLAHWLTKRPEGWNGPVIDDVRTAKSLFSATLVESSWEKISSSNTSTTPLTDEQKELLAWANGRLRDSFPPVEILDLSGDLKDGVKLIHLLGAVFRGQSMGLVNPAPTMIWHAMQNASAILNFVTSQTFEKVDGVRAVDIVTGNVTAICRLLFYLRAKFDLDYLFSQTLGDLSSGSSSTSTMDTNDTIELELIEGEEVPGHLRQLMSAEDLEYYDQLAREQREFEESEALAEGLAQTHIPAPTSPVQAQESPKVSTPKKRRDSASSPSSATATPESSTPNTPKSGKKHKTPKVEDQAEPAERIRSIAESTSVSSETSVATVDTVPDTAADASEPSSGKESKGKKEKRGKKSHRSKDGTSSGASSPKLKDSGEVADPERIKTKSKSRRDKFALTPSAEQESGPSTEASTVDVPLPAVHVTETVPKLAIKVAQEQKAASHDSTRSTSDAVNEAQSPPPLSDSKASLGSSTSSGIGTPSIPGTPRGAGGTPYAVRRQHSHMRERSVPVRIKRTATIGANKIVVTDQEKVLKAQQVVRKHVAVEVMTTEQSYLNHMRLLISEVLEPVKRSKVLSTAEYNSLFSNYEQIMAHHAGFEKMISTRLSTWDDPSIMSDIFLQRTAFFHEYGPYLTNYNQASVALHHLRKKHPKFNALLRDFEDDASRSKLQSVDSFLVMPVQRLPRYVLLLRDMRKYTAPSWEENNDLDLAARHVDSILQELNSHIAPDGAQQIRKMLAVEASIQGEIPSGLMKVDRKFLKEGQVYIRKLKPGDVAKPEKKRLAERTKGLKAYVFLFNDLLVLTEPLKHAKSDDKCQFSYLYAYDMSDSVSITEKERVERNLDSIASFTFKHSDKKAKENLYVHVESDMIVLQISSTDEREAWARSMPKKL